MKLNRFFKKRGTAVACVVTMIAASPLAAQASTYEPPGINLGGTSFMDGFGATDPGFAYIGLLQYRDNNKVSDDAGNASALLKNPRIQSLVLLNQLVYTTPVRLLEGSLGFTALLPAVYLNASTDANSPVGLNSGGNVKQGDLTVGAFLQMHPVISNGRVVFSQRFELDVIAPTGAYDNNYSANPGAGFWSINPYWAMTYLPTEKLELSTRLHYLYNYKNSSPAGVAPYVRDFQAGQAVWANFAASYQVLPDFNVGLNGYYFRQISDDKENGVSKPGSRTTDLSMGPGAMWTIDRHNIVTTNVYFPVTERNTTSGVHMNLRWVHGF